jgi:hypothetical protein
VHQPRRVFGVTYDSAWFMAHRVRAICEFDSTRLSVYDSAER